MDEFVLIGDNTLPDYGMPQLNLFSSWRPSSKTLSHQQLGNLFDTSWKESPLDAIKLMFHMRNCRGGQGNRDQFYAGAQWLFKKAPNDLLSNFRWIPQYGYWKDLLNLWTITGPRSELLRAYIIIVFCNQLKKDWAQLVYAEEAKTAYIRLEPVAGPQISLAAKWAPSEGSAVDRETGLVALFCEQLSWSKQEYRQRLRTLRECLQVPETLVSLKKDPDPEMDSLIHLNQQLAKNLRNCPQIKLHNIYYTTPQEIIKRSWYGPNADMEIQWQEYLRRLAETKPFTNALAICDVSASLSTFARTVAIGLSLLISGTSNRHFRDKLLTFSSQPQIWDIKGDSLYERLQMVKSMPRGFHIDMEKICQLLGQFPKIPETVFCFTDATWFKSNFINNFLTNYETYQEKGLPMPKHWIFWNISESPVEFPTETDWKKTEQVIVMSGFSTSILSQLLTVGEIYPWSLLRSILDSPIYRFISLCAF